MVGVAHAAAFSSGTTAIHLALILAGVGAGDEVLVSTLTFSASVNPIVDLGAKPVLIDSEPQSWNMDLVLLMETLARKARQGKLPKAVVLVHLYGQSANIAPRQAACARYGVALIEDAAEALGSHYQGRSPGIFGQAGIYSFNGSPTCCSCPINLAHMCPCSMPPVIFVWCRSKRILQLRPFPQRSTRLWPLVGRLLPSRIPTLNWPG